MEEEYFIGKTCKDCIHFEEPNYCVKQDVYMEWFDKCRWFLK